MLVLSSFIGVTLLGLILIMRVLGGGGACRNLPQHPDPSHTVCVQQSVEICYDQTLDVEVAADLTVLDTLHGCGDTAYDPHLVSCKMKLPAG